jgi:hypothetical protein
MLQARLYTPSVELLLQRRPNCHLKNEVAARAAGGASYRLGTHKVWPLETGA